MNEPASTDRVPSLRAVAVLLTLELLAVERAPWWAAQWLAQGHDGRALRELAGLNGKDPRTVRDLLPAALAETGAEVPSTQLAAASESFRELAAALVTRRADPQWVVKRVEQIIVQVHYDDEVLSLPRGHLYGIDDEWEGGWGRSPTELKDEVEARCSQQLLPDRAVADAPEFFT